MFSYGLRAGARKLGVSDTKFKPIPPELRANHMPRTSVYKPEEVIVDLLELAARHLCVGGRLAYLLACVSGTDDPDPTHPCMVRYTIMCRVVCLFFMAIVKYRLTLLFHSLHLSESGAIDRGKVGWNSRAKVSHHGEGARV